jgi:hypothetical protein
MRPVKISADLILLLFQTEHLRRWQSSTLK